MRKIAFHIQKGGVGKTSLSGNVSFFASRTKKTCLVDADPQGNTTSWFVNESIRYELADVLSGKATVRESLIALKENLSIIPTAAIDGYLKSYAETKLFHEPFVFDDLNSEIEKLGFQLVVFDLSPGMSILEKAVIISCEEVISPLTPEYFSIDGLETFNLAIKEINRAYRKNVQHKRVVINSMNRSFKQHKENYARFKKLDFEMFMVPQDRAIADSQQDHKSIIEFNPKSKSIRELENLTAAIVGG